MKALRFHRLGGPEVLAVDEIAEPVVKPGHVVVKVRAAGLNFADTRFIRGQYFVRPTVPDTPGMEAAGEVIAVGDDVTRVRVGDRVFALGIRAFAGAMLTKEKLVYPLPAELDDVRGAALPLQGLTAHHVLFAFGRLQPGERVLVHAAAGGVGTIAIQLAKRAGATVVASCGSDKHDLVKDLGADRVIDSRGDVLKQLKVAIGEVDLVLEMVGGVDAYKRNLAGLAQFGRMVVYGAASGETRGQIEPIGLMGKNHSVSGYYLTPVLERRDLCAPPLAEMASAVARGELRVTIGGTFALEDGARAFEELESRGSRGKLLLIPDHAG